MNDVGNYSFKCNDNPVKTEEYEAEIKKVPQKVRFHKTVTNLAHPLLFFRYIISHHYKKL